MSFDDAVIFNDSQQYTDLYRIKSGKQLLAPLNEQKAYIFITKQIVNEVNKHKLPEARKFFSEKCQIGAAPNCALPDHLFDDSGATVARIREKLKSAGDNVNEANRELQAAVAKTLLAISRSEDVVSKALQPLFATAVPHQPDELERARLRKDMGIPPGKQKDSLGDGLNWEQFLSFVKRKGKKRLWIISRDGDYTVKYKDQVMLLPTLHQELMDIDPNIEVYAFDTISEGIRHFAKLTGAKADTLPKDEVIEEIKKEQESLPRWKWYPAYPWHNATITYDPNSGWFVNSDTVSLDSYTAVNPVSCVVGVAPSEFAYSDISFPDWAQSKK